MMMAHNLRQIVLDSLQEYLRFWSQYDVPEGSAEAAAGTLCRCFVEITVAETGTHTLRWR